MTTLSAADVDGLRASAGMRINRVDFGCTHRATALIVNGTTTRFDNSVTALGTTETDLVILPGDTIHLAAEPCSCGRAISLHVSSMR